MARILIIDDEAYLCKLLASAVEHMGHEAVCAETLDSGLAANRENDFDVVYLDVNLPDGNGLEALPKIKTGLSAPEAIIITGRGDPDGAVLAVESGAWDYIQKPLSIKDLSLQLHQVLLYREEKKTGRQFLKRDRIIGNSAGITQCLGMVSQAAGMDANVLISGETGTGKELFAHAIHQNSSRKDNDFVIVDCATLPETLVESILFGHVKGAYTGAEGPRQGLISQADNGTLFLDEVGELPLPTQKAFLRVLQEHRYRPVGAKHEHASNFRLVAATNRKLDLMATKGLFREDLLYRLRSITIDLPPLRKRSGDVMELALHYVTRYCKRSGIGTKGFSPGFIEALETYAWPGNVRELINCLESALTEAGGQPTLIPRHLPIQIRVQLARKSFDAQTEHEDKRIRNKIGDTDPSLGTYKSYKEAVEKQYLEELMLVAQHDIKQACQISEISRARLYALLKKNNLPK